jgi:hypothetical protein
MGMCKAVVTVELIFSLAVLNTYSAVSNFVKSEVGFYFRHEIIRHKFNFWSLTSLGTQTAHN